MTSTGDRRERLTTIRRRIAHPEAILLAVIVAGLAVAGWLLPPFWMAVAIAGQLVVGGLGAVWVIGPIQIRFGFARYGTFAVAGVAFTLLGRLLSSLAQIAAAPIVALILFGVLWLEIRLPEGRSSRLAVDLSLVAIVFAAAAGVAATFPTSAWPPTVVLVVIAAAIPAMRAAELHGRYGVEAVGQAVLQLLAV
ncbi:MAG: hypothetical protein ACXWWU_03275, partial [Candidatus Limnocylindria bacterium]